MRTAVTTRLVRTAALMVPVLMVTVVLLAAPSLAGGPTSVLLVVPGGGGATALYYDDPAYAELAGLLGADTGTTPAGDTSGDGHEAGTAVTVTWLIHDVAVWRVDRVYLGGGDGPWVATQVQYGGDISATPVSWQRPAEPKALLALFERLGLDLGGDGDRTALTGAQPSPETSAVAREALPAAQQPTPPPDRGVPWLMLAVASGAGALVAVAATLPLARRSGTRRSAVIDASGADAEAGWSPAEELVSQR